MKLFLLVCLSVAGLSSQTAIAQDKVTTIPVPDRGQPAGARIDADGNIHLVFNSGQGPHDARSTDGGKTFEAAIASVDRASRKPNLEFQIEGMEIGKGGKVHVAMSTNSWKIKLPLEQWGFMYATLDLGAKEFAPV